MSVLRIISNISYETTILLSSHFAVRLIRINVRQAQGRKINAQYQIKNTVWRVIRKQTCRDKLKNFHKRLVDKK